MNAPVRDRSPWPLVAIGLAALSALGVALGVASNILSPSVWLDLLALWPLPVAGTVIALVMWLVTRRRRHLAMVGLSLFTWVTLGLALHLSAATWLPVAAATLVGPGPPEGSTGRLVIDLDTGTLQVGAGDTASYRVVPLRTGGGVAAPLGYEQQRGTEWTAAIVPRQEPGLFLFGGWDVTLSPAIGWSLELTAPQLELDLDGLGVSAVEIGPGTSRIRLGEASGEPGLALSGNAILEIPADVPFRLVGSVTGPAGWPVTEDGLVSPAGSEGWVITVAPGAQVEVVEG